MTDGGRLDGKAPRSCENFRVKLLTKIVVRDIIITS